VTTILRTVAASACLAARRVCAAVSSNGHLLACVVALSIAGFSSTADAQQTPAPAAAENSDTQAISLEEVTVTGSRIKRTTDFTTPTPTTVIDSSDMQSLGVVNVGAALAMTPANISQFTPASSGNAIFFTGAYIADLRGLNPYFGSRTLTLIDGRRVVQSDQGDSFDLNFIPQILVDRIDTVTGGASATYGSGAIAGVVNVILDRKLEGGKVDGDFYETSHSDARDRHFGAAYGHGFLDDRIHFVIGGEYEHQDALGCPRSWCEQDAGLYPTNAGSPVAAYGYGTNLRANQTSSTGTVFNAYGPGASQTLQFTPDGLGVEPFSLGENPYASNPLAARNVVSGGQGPGIYQYSNLMAPVSRGVITGLLTARITEDITFSMDANWGKVETLDYNGNIDYGESVFPSSNAYLTPELATELSPDASTRIPGGIPSISLNKDWTSQAPSTTSFTTTVQRITAGLDGKIGQTSWTWDGYLEYGLTHRVQFINNDIHLYEMSMAEDAITGPNGQPECRVTADGYAGAAAANPGASYARAGAPLGSLLAQGCVPISPLGNQPLSQAQMAYAFGYLDDRLRYEQTVGALGVSGNYFRGIGAGPWALAGGFEWRQEVGDDDQAPCEADDLHCLAVRTDYLIQYGDPFGGIVTVDEGYVETNIPLAKDLPGAHLLELDLSARESHYDSKALYGDQVVAGETSEFTHNLNTWKASAIYEPVNWLRLRASESRDARAPNFRELYYGQTISAGGIFGYCGPAGTFLDPCTEKLEGNVNLNPETSYTTTVGFILTPQSVVPGFQLSADYFHIKIDNAIEQASTSLTQSECKAGLPGACSGITFIPGTGGAAAYAAGAANIEEVVATSYNGAFYEEAGVDLSLNDLEDLGAFGTLKTRLLTTWTNEQKFASCTLGPQFGCLTYNILGQTGAGNGFLADYTPAAKWRGTLGITWSQGPISITPSMNFIGQGTADYLGVTPAQGALYTEALKNPNLLGPGIDLHPMATNHMPSYFLFNLNGTYTFQNTLKGLQLFAQINNLLNKSPPFASGVGLTGAANSPTNLIYYDGLGLAYRVGFRLSF
jgi:iron complex outermembrane recepter protein